MLEFGPKDLRETFTQTKAFDQWLASQDIPNDRASILCAIQIARIFYRAGVSETSEITAYVSQVITLVIALLRLYKGDEEQLLNGIDETEAEYKGKTS
jgi:hypothetical protein